MGEATGEPPRGATPLWFAPAVNAVLGSDAVLGATGPAALEQVVCAHVADEVEHCAPVLGPLGEVPHWLRSMTSIRATAEGLRLRDEYGTRQTLIVPCTYSGDDPAVFLFDRDVSNHAAELISPGAHADLDTAAAAWRSAVGDTTGAATPDFGLLAQVSTGQHGVMGTETREIMGNWFRAEKRIAALARLLADRRTPLPEPDHLRGDTDVEPVVTEFTAWHRERHRTEPDPEATSILAGAWTGGVRPKTWYLSSPERVADRRALLGDWLPDHAVTAGVTALPPEWSRWLGERPGLRPDLVERAVAAGRLP